MNRTSRWAIAGLSLLLASGLGAQEAIAGGELPPPGYGSLNQDQISVRVTSGDIEVRFLPLDERLIRLVAPDGYKSLSGLVAARRAQIDSAARAAGLSSPGLALVTFFALRNEASFDPENVGLNYRNQFYRPAGIVPISATFSGRRLGVRQQASAIYLFELTLPVFEQFGVVYGTSQSDAWNDILRRVDRERVRVLSRWQAERQDSTRQ